MELILDLATITVVVLVITYMVSDIRTDVKKVKEYTYHLEDLLNKTNDRIDDLAFVMETPKQKPKEGNKPKEKKIAQPPSRYGEEWKPLAECFLKGDTAIEDYYLISSMGNVWDKKHNRMMAAKYDPRVGSRVRVKGANGKFQQRNVKLLVAATFIGEQNRFYYKVVHCDGNPRNNAASNLRWEKMKRGKH